MPKFLFVYRDSATAPQPSPKEIQASLGAWGEWIGKFMQSGNILDAGDGLKPTGKVVKKTGMVTDGPFVEAKEMLGGYSVIQADSYDKAAAIAKECPAVLHGGSVEIREMAGYV